MINKLKLFTLSLFVGLTLATSQSCYGSEESYDEEVVTPNLTITNLPPEILEMILIPVISDGQSPWEIAGVCRDWHDFIKAEMQKGNRVWDVWTGVKTPEDKATYRLFRDMKLIYRPDPNSDEGMISLLIPEGVNPLRYTFDLSSCGNRDRQYVVITNDLERFFTIKEGNENKLVVYFGPHFWINKNINDLATPFKDIMGSWNAEQAPIGIFWRWGNRPDVVSFDFLTTSSLSEMSHNALYVHWKKAYCVTRRYSGRGWSFTKFRVGFLNQKLDL